ncbi:NAD-glutamate dehydrogenase [Heliothis virescens ascovirus 3f]|uniref:NAD-glutamate dehydrogenase n=1 Tax=Heliothis virescens ascovirus 3f TaxID=328614 RepID=A0A171PVH9_9VIRU|nr:NAD-glutamate dehydrogenase [Heliothis virescens ascovirus 3f]AJP09068.1 NAD-glutamate dehydrogenase [Heliothis virescens ascovirus 3f]
MPRFSWYQREREDEAKLEGVIRGRYTLTDNETYNKLSFSVKHYLKLSGVNIVREDDVLPREEWFNEKADSLEERCMNVVARQFRDRYDDLKTFDLEVARKFRDYLRDIGVPWKLCAPAFFKCTLYTGAFPMPINIESECPRGHASEKKFVMASLFCRECGDEFVTKPNSKRNYEYVYDYDTTLIGK